MLKGALAVASPRGAAGVGDARWQGASVLPLNPHLSERHTSGSYHEYSLRPRHPPVVQLRAALCHVAYWHKADMPTTLGYVRFRGESGHSEVRPQCRLMTHSRLSCCSFR